MRLPLLIAGSVLAAASLNVLAAERSLLRPQSTTQTVPARVIVQFKEGAPVLRAHALAAGDSALVQRSALDGRAQALGGRHGLALRGGAAIGAREQVLHGPAGLSSRALAERLAADPDVAWAEPDLRVRRLLVPNDPLFSNGGARGPAVGQWYLGAPAGEVRSSIDAVREWDTTTGSAGVIVAVLDTGVRPDHPDLAGKLVAGRDFVSNEGNGQPPISNDGDGYDSDPSDPGDWLTQSEINADPTFWDGCEASTSSWHGTQVAGIVGASTSNGSGMAGTGWNAGVMPVRVLGKCFGYTSDIQAAMRWAAGLSVSGVPDNPNPVQVINLSLGGSATCNSSWSSVIAEVTQRGVVVVAAAGNSAGRAASAPANCPGVIGVAGVRHVGSKVGFSDVGSQLSIAAPGGNCVNLNGACLYPILTTSDSGTFGPAGSTYTDGFDVSSASVGTSFSAPLVSGTVALMLSARAGLTPQQVRTALQSSARPFPASGLIDEQSGQPLQACRAPNNTDQGECYCTTSTCGAGLLDAGAAVAAALALPAGGDDDDVGNVDASGGGGGGGMSLAWLLALCAAVALLLRRGGGSSSLVLLVMVAAASWGVPSSSWAAAADGAVRGLIVQLRDAPSHATLARERAQGGAAAAAEQVRWQRMVSALPSLRVVERRAVGASAQVLRFDRPLGRQEAQALAAQMAQQPDVAWAVPNTRERRLQAAGNPPTDPLFGGFNGQWWLQPAAGSDGVPITQRLRGVAGFQTAWTSVTTGSANAVVAVLDNGIVAHPDLAGKVIAGYDMVSDSAYSNDGDGRDADPSDPGDWVDSADLARPEYAGCALENSSWHGTAIAGMLAANVNNNQGGASINWPGRVLAVRVAAKCGADVSDIVDGMRWVAGRSDVCRRSDAFGTCVEFVPANTNPARVINISFGGSGSCDAYQGAIDELRALGIVVVAAAGNEHAATPTRPARCPGVIGVTALNRDGFKSTYANFGPALTVATVGGDDPDGAWGPFVADSGLVTVGNFGDRAPELPGHFPYFGTSFSTPIVAGAAGLMLAVNSGLTAAQIEQGLRVSARPHVTSTLTGVGDCSDANPGRCRCTTATCGAGILDVPRALAYAANPNGYVATPLQAAVNNSAEWQAAAAAGPDRPSNAPEPPVGNADDGGGGPMSPLWLFGLVLATAALVQRRCARR